MRASPASSATWAPALPRSIRSKLDGLRQVWSAINDSYSRPIPTPVRSMRPSRDTCEHCHWPNAWHGDGPLAFAHTYPDETNTERVNVLVLKVGGRHPGKGTAEGAHWHAATDTVVRYEAYDAKRTRIGKVEVLRDGKVVEEFLPPGAAEPVVATRTMDCIDCHNRPTHVFDESPSRALDRAFAAGALDRGTKWLRQARRAPAGRHEPHAGGGRGRRPARALEAAYRAKHADAVPDATALDRAAKGLADLWRRNVYPDRGASWGTYPSHGGHQDATPALHGCFRCHDDKHKTADGHPLSGDCEVCHQTLAQDEKFSDLDESVRAMIGSR